MNQRVIISTHLENELVSALSECEHDKLFVLTDTTTQEKCLPVLQKFYCMKEAKVITIPASDSHKDIESLMMVWKGLQEGGASRHSCMINLGGGMVTDLGGFAASTFKRGINFINIPTTLLAMVDASVGGKTGINFGGLKNEVGVFNDSKFVILDTEFLKTLDAENICSGYAEMLKHGLIHSKAHWDECMAFDIENIDYETLNEMIARSVAIKEHFVVNDPTEQNIRKALNLGHTVGHAFESLALHQQRPILHGYAVAYGIIVELYLSAQKVGLSMQQVEQISKWIIDIYGTFSIAKSDYESLYLKMTKDKKNEAGRINFTLIPEIGRVEINVNCEKELIFKALDFFSGLTS